jgi:arylformamidase
MDVSLPLRDGMVHWPGDTPFERKMNMEISNGDLVNLSQITGSAHTGTHMDAPLHFIPNARSIDTMPLSATIGPARVVGIEDAEAIKVSELAKHNIASGERILFRTANSGRLWKTDLFHEDYVYINPGSAEYLAAIGIQTVGVDYLSVGGFYTGNAETHRALLGAGIWVIEGLNLEHVEPGEYDMICLPLKLVGADGAPARAVLRKLNRTT